MKMTHIEIPAQFNRNSSNVLALGVENTGLTIINCGNELLGCSDLSSMDVLDIGCGGRFTQTIINRDLLIKSYTGIDIYEPLIRYLIDNVQDSRFSFHYWHIYNEMYNATGKKLTQRTRLPLSQDKKFDVIWMYSVITHTYPWETECLFYILRRYIKKDGGLLFSAFIDNDIDTFEDRIKAQPLANACYKEKFLRQIISKRGWQVESVYDKTPDTVMQNLFLCRPKYHFWELF
jgi:2-polyprenyl-3-methyl-5-hydroxy-6-metoxy-1,4-benzoquinol methylase